MRHLAPGGCRARSLYLGMVEEGLEIEAEGAGRAEREREGVTIERGAPPSTSIPILLSAFHRRLLSLSFSLGAAAAESRVEKAAFRPRAACA